jgi:hypothetical protein
MFGRAYGTATSRAGFERFGEDAPRHPSRDEDSAVIDVSLTKIPSPVNPLRIPPVALVTNLHQLIQNP